MTPTPSPHSSFADNIRFGRRRAQRNTNPYDATRNITPTQIVQPQEQEPVSPHVDGANEESSGEDIELEDGEIENEEIDEVDGEIEEEGNNVEEEGEEEGEIEEAPMEIEVPFDATALGLKEIGNLASWTVSSCKPGCGVDALRDEDTNLFWQSDGPQPHHLNIHFSRLVSILSIRIFLDFEADESYTPTRIKFFAGTGYHDLIEFYDMNMAQPKGWQDVDLQGVGGGEDGKTLRAFLLQVKVLENHQNGKDTHVRGLKVYARDERAGRGGGMSGIDGLAGGKRREIETENHEGGWIVEPDWMGEQELR